MQSARINIIRVFILPELFKNMQYLCGQSKNYTVFAYEDLRNLRKNSLTFQQFDSLLSGHRNRRCDTEKSVVVVVDPSSCTLHASSGTYAGVARCDTQRNWQSAELIRVGGGGVPRKQSDMPCQTIIALFTCWLLIKIRERSASSCRQGGAHIYIYIADIRC